MKLTRTLPALLAAAALVAGCGGGAEESSSSEPAAVQAGAETNETFSEEGFDITFEYPEDFEVLQDVQFSRSAGVEAGATTAVGLDVGRLGGRALLLVAAPAAGDERGSGEEGGQRAGELHR